MNSFRLIFRKSDLIRSSVSDYETQNFGDYVGLCNAIQLKVDRLNSQKSSDRRAARKFECNYSMELMFSHLKSEQIHLNSVQINSSQVVAELASKSASEIQNLNRA